MSEDAVWALVIGVWVILFWGEPDLLDALISYLNGGAMR